jgi:hypothetical protein
MTPIRSLLAYAGGVVEKPCTEGRCQTSKALAAGQHKGKPGRYLTGSLGLATGG